MKTIDIDPAGPPMSELVEQAKTEPILIRSAGGHMFVLAEVDETDAEAILLAHSGRLQQIIERSRARAQREGWLTTAQLREHLGL